MFYFAFQILNDIHIKYLYVVSMLGYLWPNSALQNLQLFGMVSNWSQCKFLHLANQLLVLVCPEIIYMYILYI